MSDRGTGTERAGLTAANSRDAEPQRGASYELARDG